MLRPTIHYEGGEGQQPLVLFATYIASRSDFDQAVEILGKLKESFPEPEDLSVGN